MKRALCNVRPLRVSFPVRVLIDYSLLLRNSGKINDVSDKIDFRSFILFIPRKREMFADYLITLREFNRARYFYYRFNDVLKK